MGLRRNQLWLGCAIAVGVALAAPRIASADRLTEEPEVAPDVSISYKIRTHLTELSSELDKHLSALSFDLVGLRFDAVKNEARVKLDTGGSEDLSFRLDGDVQFRHGVARVKAKVDLGLAGRRFSFELPEFDMVPRSWDGKRYVELRLPLIEGSF